MNKLKTFAITFKRNLTDLSYYKDVLKAPFTFSLKYLVFFLFLVSLLATIQVSIKAISYIPKVDEFEVAAYEYLRDVYPDDLVITIENNELSINQPTPYVIEFPEDWKSELGEANLENLVTFDTSDRINDFHTYKSFAVVSKRAIYVYDDNGGSRSIPLEVEEDLIIDKGVYDQAMVGIGSIIVRFSDWYIILVAVGTVLAPFFITFFSVLWKLFYLVLLAFPLWVFARIANRNLEYMDVVKIGAHTITLPVLITFLMESVWRGFPFVHTLVFLAFTTVVIIKLKD